MNVEDSPPLTSRSTLRGDVRCSRRARRGAASRRPDEPTVRTWTRSARALLLALPIAMTWTCTIPHWPVSGPVTSPFGVRTGGWFLEVHRGVDISVPEGTAVRAMAPGRVRFAGTMSGYGKVVWIDHDDDLRTVYAHLSEIRAVEGETVGGDDVIGLSGSSGGATGPHLHFEIWRRGREVDPVLFLGGTPRTG